MGTETFLSNYAELEQELCMTISEIIKTKFPDITESVDLPAKMIAYSYGPTYKQLLFTVFPSKKGVKLNNAHGLLKGTGKISRYIQFYQLEQLENPVIEEILNEAYQLYLVRIT